MSTQTTTLTEASDKMKEALEQAILRLTHFASVHHTHFSTNWMEDTIRQYEEAKNA